MSEYKITTLPGILAGLSADQYDLGVAGINDTEERKKNVDFVKPFYWGYIAVLTQTAAQEDGLDDFSGKKVWAVEGSVRQTFAETKPLGAVVTGLKDQPSAIRVTPLRPDRRVRRRRLCLGGVHREEKGLKIAAEGDNLRGRALPMQGTSDAAGSDHSGAGLCSDLP